MDIFPPEGDVLVYGHFHTGYITEKEGVICVNAGSVSLPKNNTPNSYLIIDEENIYLKDLDANIIDKIKY
jgi:predicted phosphodiesterase